MAALQDFCKCFIVCCGLCVHEGVWWQC